MLCKKQVVSRVGVWECGCVRAARGWAAGCRTVPGPS